MSPLGQDVRWAARKATDLLALGGQLVKARELPPRKRALLGMRSCSAVASNARQIRYLGHPLRYDNRLLPALLPAYLAQIRRLDRLVGLASCRYVIDVGANIGQFAATLSWRFPGTEVWSFEPDPAAFGLLQQNAAETENWVVIPWGIAEQDGEIGVRAADGKSGQASLWRANATSALRGAQASEHRVVMKRLHRGRIDALGIPARVDMVKVDVAGAEASALSGLADLKWRFMALETSLQRAGGLTVAGALDLAEALWSVRPTVVWKDREKAGAATADVVLAMPHDA